MHMHNYLKLGEITILRKIKLMKYTLHMHDIYRHIHFS